MATKDKDWDAPVQSGGDFEDAVRYRARAGFNDLLVILTKCKSTPRHWTGKKFPGQKFYLRCLEEDNAPCCELLGKPSPSNSAYVIHVAERKGDGDWKELGIPKVWGFSDKIRGKAIFPIHRDFCGGDDGKFHKTILLITCVDEQFQNLSIIPYNGKEIKVTKEMKEAAKASMNMFMQDISVDKDNILTSIERLTGESADDSEEEPEVASSEEPAKKEETPAESEEEGEDIDFDQQMASFMEDLEDDEEE